MGALTDAIIRPAARLGAAAQNALEVARFGGLDTGEQSAPYEIAAEQRNYMLRRYFPDTAATGPPVLLIPPMMLAADVYDISPAASAVSVLAQQGAQPWVVDFGAREQIAGAAERTLTDHVLAVSDAIDRIRALTGRDVHLGGYSQGGMFCYQAAAYRRSDGLASVIAFGSPVDTLGALPFGIPEVLAVHGAGFLAAHVLPRQTLPAWASRAGFRALDPVKALRRQIEFVMSLHDREALLPRERQRRFVEQRGWLAWPGPALADFVGQFIVHNRMLSGFVIADRPVTLADITLPVLTVVGEADAIAPPPSVRAIRRAAPRADVHELTLREAGHFGLVVGSAAARTTWPAVAAWAHWCDDGAPLPDSIRKMDEDEDEDDADGSGGRLELAAGTALGAVRGVLGTTTRAATVVARRLTEQAAATIPRWPV